MRYRNDQSFRFLENARLILYPMKILYLIYKLGMSKWAGGYNKDTREVSSEMF